MMRIEQTIVIRHKIVTWFLGVITGAVAFHAVAVYPGWAGMAICAVLLFVSLQMVKQYADWTEQMPKSDDQE